MQTKNVYYSNQPDAVIVTERGKKAVVEFPCNVTEIKEGKILHGRNSRIFRLI